MNANVVNGDTVNGDTMIEVNEVDNSPIPIAKTHDTPPVFPRLLNDRHRCYIHSSLQLFYSLTKYHGLNLDQPFFDDSDAYPNPFVRILKVAIEDMHALLIKQQSKSNREKNLELSKDLLKHFGYGQGNQRPKYKTLQSVKGGSMTTEQQDPTEMFTKLGADILFNHPRLQTSIGYATIYAEVEATDNFRYRITSEEFMSGNSFPADSEAAALYDPSTLYGKG
jgi:hypothetical protein